MTVAAFVLFPLLGWALYSVLPLRLAIPTTLVSGYLLLPANISYDAPMLPAITKQSMAVFTAFALAIVFHRSAAQTHPRRTESVATGPSDVLQGWIPQPLWARVLLALALFGPGMTALSNMHPVSVGPIMLPAMSPYDALNLVQMSLVALLPLLLARKYLASASGHVAILLVFATAGLVYSLPTLAEVRLSPQLHILVYGYFPHEFRQHIRGDGFRPVVFLGHGLALSLFLCLSALSILAYMRAIDGDRRVLYFFAAAYLTIVLFLSKSLGMVLVAIALIPVMLFFSVRWQLLAAAALAAAVLLYPVARSAGSSPLSPLVSAVYSINPLRAGSLEYRLDNEDLLVEHANRKPLFGWGGWGRAEVFDDRGRIISVRDGTWIIKLGQYGWVGMVSLLGLLTAPILVLAWQGRRYPLTAATSGLCVVLAANLIDLIPNSGLTPITWLMAGALMGHLEHLRQGADPSVRPAGSPAPATIGPGPAATPPGPVYARNAPPLLEARADAPMRKARDEAVPTRDIEKLPLAARLRARAMRNRGDRAPPEADRAEPRPSAVPEASPAQPAQSPRYTRFTGQSPRGTRV